MKAMLCQEYGPPESLTLQELPSPPLGKGMARIQVHACGVNFPDTLIIQGKYQFKPAMPFAPGGEVAGIVTEVAENVTQVKVGDRVIAGMLFGGYADEAVVAASLLIPMPTDMPFTEAAGLPLVYGTVLHALKQRAQLQPNETLLVLGASGGVGLACVQLGKIMGAKVIAAASTAEKLALCEQQGADELINYETEDLRGRLKSITKGKGVDVVFDPVGGDLFEKAARSLAWEGRLLVVGFASGTIPSLAANLALLKGAAIMGVFWGQFTMRQPQENAQNTQQLIQWYAAGKYKPVVSATYPLADASKAMYSMLRRKATGKVVLTTEHFTS